MPILISAATILLLILAVTFGASILGGPAVIGSSLSLDYSEATGRLELLLNSVDQIVTMLTTITLGLAVVVGASLREVWAKGVQPSKSAVLAALGFLVGIFASFFYAYGARQQAFEFVVFGHLDFLSLKEIFVMQAISVGVAASMAFYLLLTAFLRTDTTAIAREQTDTVNAHTDTAMPVKTGEEVKGA